MAKVTLGSISHGTLKLDKLLVAFASELQSLDEGSIEHTETIENAYWAANNYDTLTVALHLEAEDTIDELIDALNQHAPPYCYFGANEGDGSDFGFWPDHDAIATLPHFDHLAEAVEFDGECALVDAQGDVVAVYDAGNPILELPH